MITNLLSIFLVRCYLGAWWRGVSFARGISLINGYLSPDSRVMRGREWKRRTVLTLDTCYASLYCTVRLFRGARLCCSLHSSLRLVQTILVWCTPKYVVKIPEHDLPLRTQQIRQCISWRRLQISCGVESQVSHSAVIRINERLHTTADSFGCVRRISDCRRNITLQTELLPLTMSMVVVVRVTDRQYAAESRRPKVEVFPASAHTGSDLHSNDAL